MCVFAFSRLLGSSERAVLLNCLSFKTMEIQRKNMKILKYYFYILYSVLNGRNRAGVVNGTDLKSVGSCLAGSNPADSERISNGCVMEKRNPWS